MKTVSRFEANLLHLLRFFLRKAPAAQAEPILVKEHDQPPCLSRACVELVQDTLGNGCVLLLAHAHGWRPERFLREGRVAEGRLWERTTPETMALTFSKHTLRFLIWMTSAQMPDKPRTQPNADEMTVGDWLFFYYAYGALKEFPASDGLWRQTPFLRNPLCRLAYPEDFGEAAADTLPNFAPWTKGVGACILEALQNQLRDRWVEIERGKSPTPTWKIQRSRGQSQEQVLTAFLNAVETCGRRDLARFLLQAVRIILADRDNPYAWMENLNMSRERLADRADTYRAILALPRQFQRLSDWEQRARGVGYFDEEYASSQLWKGDWEQARGEELHQRTQEIIRRWEEWR